YQWTPANLPRWLSWIGMQRLATHGETVRNSSVNWRYAPYITDDHTWTNRANRTSVSQVTERFYVGDNQGQNLDYGPSPIESVNGSYNLNWFNNLTGQWVSEPTTVGTLPVVNTTRNQNQIRTINATLQSFFLD